MSGLRDRLFAARPLLGEILVRRGIVSKEQLAAALELQRRTGQKLGRVLVDLGFAAEWDVSQALAEQQNGGTLSKEEHDALLKEVQSRMLARGIVGKEDIRPMLANVCRDVLATRKPKLLSMYQEFAADAYDRLYSLGPLEKHLRPGSDAVNITVLGTTIIVERTDGTKETDPGGFVSEEEIRRAFDRVAARAGRELSISDPSLDAELPDGSRILLVIPPESERPYASIRRHVKKTARLSDLFAGCKGLDKMAFYLTKAVRERKNMVIAGSTNSGKTTLMNALLYEVQPLHTVAILEDTREIDLDLPYVAYFKTRDIPGAPPVTWGRILKDCLRFTPQRIVLTEVRTPEAAYEFVQVLNTGHAGSFTSVHASSALDALFRLETLVQEWRNLPIEVIRRLLARVVDIVVFITLLEDERGAVIGRRLAEVVEVSKDLVGGMYDLREVWRG